MKKKGQSILDRYRESIANPVANKKNGPANIDEMAKRYAYTVLAHCKNIDEAVGMLYLIRDEVNSLADQVLENPEDANDWILTYEEAASFLVSIKGISELEQTKMVESTPTPHTSIADLEILL